MSDPSKQVYDSALQLPRDARAELVAILAVRADDTDESAEAMRAKWFAEPRLRLARIDAAAAVLFALEGLEAELGYCPGR